MITDLLGGHIDMLFNNRSTLLTHFKARKLKALAVTSESRWPELPDTPTMTEVGVVGFPQGSLFGLLAPAGTPTAIIDKLNHAVNEGLEIRGRARRLGKDRHGGKGRNGAGLRRRARGAGARVEKRRRRDRDQGGLNVLAGALVIATSTLPVF